MWTSFLFRCVKKVLEDHHRRHSVLGVILLMIPLFGNFAQAEQLSWVKQVGDAGEDTPQWLVIDGSGNIYVTGYFEGTNIFGAGEANETELRSSGSGDIFVAKYNTNGELVWAKKAGGRSKEWGYTIDIDDSGNSYVSGWLGAGDVIFGAGEANETTLTGRGTITDVFMAKYNIDGDLVWAKQAGSSRLIFPLCNSVDGGGNSYVTSFFWETVTLGAGEANETELRSSGSGDIFVAKYDTNGELVWATQIGGPGNEQNGGITVDGNGNIYVTGFFSSETTTFGEEGNYTTLTSTNEGQDIFVAKYNNDGGLVWAKQAVATGSDASWGITVDDSGNSYVTGYIDGTTIFGAGEANETSLSTGTRGSSEIFVAKYDTDGRLVWAKQAGGEHNGTGNWIAVDSSGNSYVSGSFTGIAIFGEVTNPITLTSTESDAFVAKYSTNGELLWAKQVATNVNYGIGIATDGVGNIYETGSFEGTAIFAEGEADETRLTSRGSTDIFVAKYLTNGGETLIGDEVTVAPVDPSPDVEGTSVNITFSTVTTEGTTTVTSEVSETPPPTGYSLGNPPVYFDIATTADYVSPITVCINYTATYGDESNLKLFHWEATTGEWVDITTSLDTSKKVICGVSDSLSPFAIFEHTYQFVGFFEPVQNGSVVNLVKAGKAIPLKWQLHDKQGSFISDLSAVTGIRTQNIDCPDGGPRNEMEGTLSSGSSGLHYDFSSNQFVYAWMTAKNMEGLCYRLDVELFGRYVHSAYFQMW